MMAIIVGPSALFEILRSIIDYVLPLPAFIFLSIAGFLSRGMTRLAYVLGILLFALLVSTVLWGPLPLFGRIHDIAMSVALVVLIVQSLRRRDEVRDFVIMRRGLLIYLVFLLGSYIAGLFGVRLRLEPYGFAILLGALCYVAAQQTLRRDQEFHEITRELEIAKRIQLSILPERFPPSASLRVAARYKPMTAIAGDFYEFLVVDDQHVGLLIADVSGHGIPAALISSMMKLGVSMLRSHASSPSDLLSAMNVALCGNTQMQFVTAAYVYLNAELRELRYSAAGHPPMLLLRSGEVMAIEKNGLLLAAFPFAEYATAIHPLKSGDRLLLYTDGVVEATNARQEEFGQDRLCVLLQQTSNISLEETADLIVSSIEKWSVSQGDDLTLLLCECIGPHEDFRVSIYRFLKFTQGKFDECRTSAANRRHKSSSDPRGEYIAKPLQRR